MIEPEVSGEFVPPLLKDVKCRRIREFEGPPGCVRLVSTGLSKLRTFNHQWHSITSGPTMSDITFQGIDDKECESFIRAVTRKGFVDERDTDDNWMARFAATCFEGPALRWYDQLTEETQGSWRSLRKALLSQYPARPKPSNVPTPAAAEPSPTALSWNRIPSRIPTAEYASRDRLRAQAGIDPSEDRSYLRSRAEAQTSQTTFSPLPHYSPGAAPGSPHPWCRTRRNVFMLVGMILLLYLISVARVGSEQSDEGVKSRGRWRRSLRTPTPESEQPEAPPIIYL